MYRLLVLVTLISTAFSGSIANEPNGLVFEGTDTTIEAYPYQVSLWLIEAALPICGGSIISEYLIVTAARCVVGLEPSDLQVRLGSANSLSGGLLIDVFGLIYHPDFDANGTAVNDIGLLRLGQPIEESKSIRYIELAEVVPATGTPAVVTGWNISNSANILHAIEVSIVQRQDCASNAYRYGEQIKETMVCATATDKSVCSRNSGGPLVAEGNLVGIVSWSEGCAEEGYPDVFASIPELYQWIVRAILIL